MATDSPLHQLTPLIWPRRWWLIAVLINPLAVMAWEKTVTIQSQGTDNRAQIDQSASDGNSLIQIDQVSDSIGLNQAGIVGAPIRQTGASHTVMLSQVAWGLPSGPTGNRFSSDQSGLGMSIYARQNGGGDHASVVQRGEAANTLQLQQSGNARLDSALQDSGSEGDGLAATIRQTGGGRIGALSQSGNNNALDIQQDKTGPGGELALDVGQSGLGNRLNVSQQTHEGSATLSQTGKNNQLSFTQDQPIYGISVSQTGTGANVSIYNNPAP